MHDKNIKKVQVETIKIITETEKIIENIIEKENSKKEKNDTKTLSIRHLDEHQEMLTNEKQKLDNLEYVVAVVGTMKAGKSMTINAIVGQEVLPSRELPMTTLPTLITHTPKQETPILKLKNIEPFQKLVKDIKEKIDISSWGSGHIDLNTLISEIKEEKISFVNSYEGQEKIEGFLKKINDLMRIAKDYDIEPPYGEFTNVDDLPRIEVEFYHLSKEESNSNAKLTLLDTPGPDEFKHSVLLKEIFKNQLQRASAVMLLVDYTKMNSQSDVEVKEQVKDVADMVGKQHLFVLVNKFDQRKRSDDVEKKKVEAKRLIVEDVLKDKISENNVYPISAKSAFYANFGLRELSKNGKIDKSLKWIDDFGVTLMGEDWEDDIDDIKRVEKKCLRTWEKSFFEEPLEKIISTIHSDALFLSLKSPLDKLDNLLREYGNAFKTRKSAYKKELTELKQLIVELKNDIDKTGEISEKINSAIIKDTDKIKKYIQTEIKTIIEKTEKKVSDLLDKNIKERDKEEKDRKNEGHNVKNESNKLWDGGLLDGFKKDKQSDIEKLKNEGKIEYNSEKEAKETIRNIENVLSKKLIESSSKMENETNERIQKLSEKFDYSIKENLGLLLKEVEKKLSDEENNPLKIELPQLDIKIEEISTEVMMTSLTKTSKDYQVRGSSIWNKVAHWFSADWGLVTKSKEVFIITKKDLISKINELLNSLKEAEIIKFEEKFKTEIQEPIEDKLKLLKKEIEGYRAEQIDVLQERENNDKNFLEERKNIAEIYQKKIDKLADRVKISKKELGRTHG